MFIGQNLVSDITSHKPKLFSADSDSISNVFPAAFIL